MTSREHAHGSSFLHFWSSHHYLSSQKFGNLQYAHFLISEQQFRVLAFVECFVSFLCPLPAGCFYPSDARWCRLGPERQLYYFSRRKCYSKFVDIEAKLPKVYEIKEIYNIIKIIRYHKFSRTIYIVWLDISYPRLCTYRDRDENI